MTPDLFSDEEETKAREIRAAKKAFHDEVRWTALYERLRRAAKVLPCQCCGKKKAPDHSWSNAVHQLGFDQGIEVPLCGPCGSSPAAYLSLEDVWLAIELRLRAIRAGASIYTSGLEIMQKAGLWEPKKRK